MVAYSSLPTKFPLPGGALWKNRFPPMAKVQSEGYEQNIGIEEFIF